MQKPSSKDTKSAFGVQDVLFIVFKHKWLILVLTLAGLAAAAAVFLTQKPIYQSKAKLLVRYVMETGSVDPYVSMKSPGVGAGRAGDPVILTEIEILKSLDLSIDVARELGVERLIPGATGPENTVLSGAAGSILGNLEVSQGESPNVLHVTYGNEQRELAKEVLQKVVELYFKKHLEIHRSAAAFDVVAKQTEEVRQRLEQTERELNRLRTDSGILSLKDATEALAAQKARTLDDLMRSRAELAEQQANFKSLEEGMATIKSSGDTLVPDLGPDGAAPAQEPASEIPSRVVTEYRAAMELLGLLRKRDLELRIKFKPGNRLLEQNQQQINTYEERRQALLGQYPALAEERVVNTADPSDSPVEVRTLDSEKARLAAVNAKIRVFEAHLEEIGRLFSEQYAIGAKIEEMDRRKQMVEAEYRSLEEKLKDARLDQTLDPARMPNITVVQEPSEPVKAFDELTMKIILGLAGGGLALGLGLAFLIELIFNRKIERPVEIQARLQLPLLLSIPFIRKSQRGGLLLGRGESAPRIEGGMDDEWEQMQDGGEIAASKPDAKPAHFIMPFSQTIRDRIIFNFEVNNVIHKPKLIAVTAMSEGAGTSTIAAGLAKSFSEIRNAKVLLVDLSSFRPHDNPVFGEIPRHSLPGALRLAQDTGFRERPQNLYYANASARRDSGGLSQFTPLHLHEMMPLMHASEYDYIIFDMPSINQTSPTVTMAGLMDKVLLVLDAENTSRDGLRWGYSELTRGRADVSCVFNKTRTHGPDWLVGNH